MDELNNIEETEEFLLINNNISEYIKKNVTAASIWAGQIIMNIL